MKTIKKSDTIDLAPWKATGGAQLAVAPPSPAPRARSRLGLALTRDEGCRSAWSPPLRRLRLTPCVVLSVAVAWSGSLRVHQVAHRDSEGAAWRARAELQALRDRSAAGRRGAADGHVVRHEKAAVDAGFD